MAPWGTMPVEDVDRLSAGGDGKADEGGQAVAGMARAGKGGQERTRRHHHQRSARRHGTG